MAGFGKMRHYVYAIHSFIELLSMIVLVKLLLPEVPNLRNLVPILLQQLASDDLDEVPLRPIKFKKMGYIFNGRYLYNSK